MPYYGLGLTSGTVIPFASSNPRLPDPYPVSYVPYTTIEGQTGTGQPVEMGPATLEWNFTNLNQNQYNYLLAFCPGSSSKICLVSRVEYGTELSFRHFYATMWRPQSGVEPGRIRKPVVLKFTDVEQLD